MKLIILAAGKGTRFLPLTEEIPKALIPVLSKPLVEYKLNLFLPHISGIIFVINDSLGHKIREHFGDEYKGIPVDYTIQDNNYPKGTFGALQCAFPLIDTENFAVCNCDDLYKKEDIDNVFKNKSVGIGVTKKPMPWYYHGIATDNDNIKGFNFHNKTNLPVLDDYFNGFSILSKGVFSFSPVYIKNGEAGLPQTIFSNLDSLPLKKIHFSEWVSVESQNDIKEAENFIKTNNLS